MSRRAFQATILAMAGIAVMAGSVTVLTGGRLILESGQVSPSVDSELRFYAAWYVGLGVLLLRTVTRVEYHGTLIRAVCGILFFAAVGRILSLTVAGPPHPLYLVLMVIELVLPMLLVPWQAAIARHSIENEAGKVRSASAGS